MISIGGYSFKTNQIQKALTHSSFSENNYERLEFLGDSILDFLIADILYMSENFAEDELTRSRANIVSESSLCKVFDKLNIEYLVKLGKSCPNITKAIKCDIVEAIIACIYLESGLDECKKFILSNFNLSPNEQKDYKTQFQEFAQKNKYLFEYKLLKTTGPDHDLTFFVSLNVNGQEVSTASAKSKAEAQKLCAKIALEKYKDLQ